MKKSIIYIIGAVALLGGGAFLFLKNRKAKDDKKLAELMMLNEVDSPSTTSATSTQQTQPTYQAPATVAPADKPISADTLLAITKLKDAIISNIGKRNSYKKSSSKANIQTVIDADIEKLKTYGFSLDMNNQLIKIK